MELGAFSISLTVKDISKSLDFYQKLGFVQTGGDIEQKWLILKNGSAVIGLFQDMFPTNIITFNPGWNQDAQEVNPFTDVREIQANLQEQGLALSKEADDQTSGPAYIALEDPDGNQILIDQHR